MTDKIELKEEDLEKASGGFKTTTGLEIAECVNVEDFACPFCKEYYGTNYVKDITLQNFPADMGEYKGENQTFYETYVCLNCNQTYAYNTHDGKWYKLNWAMKYTTEYLQQIG